MNGSSPSARLDGALDSLGVALGRLESTPIGAAAAAASTGMAAVRAAYQESMSQLDKAFQAYEDPGSVDDFDSVTDPRRVVEAMAREVVPGLNRLLNVTESTKAGWNSFWGKP
jgi:hypothetical protein